MSILCTICARGGSKGVPRKNVHLLGGKPLIWWTIEQALNWGQADYVIVSTDDDEIAEVSRAAGALVPFVRPPELSTDTVGKIPVLQHALDHMEKEHRCRFDYVVDLQPTSPLRAVVDIDGAYRSLVRDPYATNAYSVCRAGDSPYFTLVELDDYGHAHLSKTVPGGVVRRQASPIVYRINGAVYAYRRDFLLTTQVLHSERTIVYEMPAERSIDIDSAIDFAYVELLLSLGKR